MKDETALGKLFGGLAGLVSKESPGSADTHVDGGDGGKRPKKKGDPFEVASKVCKVDDSLGLVFGWAIVCKKDGADYVDLQDDHIPEDSMLKAACNFMLNSRIAKDMHQGDEIGPVVFAFPMTADIAKAMGVDTKMTGLMIAMRPPADILAKYRSGEYTGFSIGGIREFDEVA